MYEASKFKVMKMINETLEHRIIKAMQNKEMNAL